MTQPPVPGSPSGPARAEPRYLSAGRFLELVLDAGTWRPWDRPRAVDIDPGPAAEVAGGDQPAGPDEALVTGEGRLRGTRVAVVAGEFGFMAGSIGVFAARRLVAAVERATAKRLPLLASPASGGMRMQEGTAAFVQMVEMAGAITRHKATGLPYLVYLRHPTTGGVFASWGSLGHVTFAEPGALLGFIGPRVYEQLRGHPFPDGVQTAENLYARGLLDRVVAPGRFAELAAAALDVLQPPLPAHPHPTAATATAPEVGGDVPAWESITRSRRPDRPGLRALLEIAARDVTVLDGTGAGGLDRGLVLALGRFGDARCVVLGQDRHAQRAFGPIGPAGLRKARRGMRLAAELSLPLVTVVDTPGAALSREAEEGGLAGEIARCVAGLFVHPTPTLSVLLGEGTGGAAIALLPADRTVAAQHSWLSPLPLEGASAILHRTTDRAAEIARDQEVRSLDLLRLGVVDRIVDERPDAADEPEAFCRRLGQVISEELGRLSNCHPARRMSTRHRRYREIGVPR
jgi:acetyl-CoA carboxylase alpha subunit/acetyl-CoA carboxylase beta subunit